MVRGPCNVISDDEAQVLLDSERFGHAQAQQKWQKVHQSADSHFRESGRNGQTIISIRNRYMIFVAFDMIGPMFVCRSFVEGVAVSSNCLSSVFVWSLNLACDFFPRLYHLHVCLACSLLARSSAEQWIVSKLIKWYFGVEAVYVSEWVPVWMCLCSRAHGTGWNTQWFSQFVRKTSKVSRDELSTHTHTLAHTVGAEKMHRNKQNTKKPTARA